MSRTLYVKKQEIFLTRHVKSTAVAISERQVGHAFQFTIGFRVNFEELQVTFTSKIALSP
jgi:hypothetical protein